MDKSILSGIIFPFLPKLGLRTSLNYIIGPSWIKPTMLSVCGKGLANPEYSNTQVAGIIEKKKKSNGLLGIFHLSSSCTYASHCTSPTYKQDPDQYASYLCFEFFIAV